MPKVMVTSHESRVTSHAFAAVMTGKGTGAISTIQVFGSGSRTIVKKIFRPAATKSPTLKPGKILFGTIHDAGETIDEVTIGCEGPETITINCHGNPLILEMIMQLLAKHGAMPTSAEQLLIKILSTEKSITTIALEAKLALPGAKTLEGAKIIANQIDAGLSKTTAQWLRNINATAIDKIRGDAEQILERSQTAKLIIHGCKAVITGPPNSGKSTLLNCLAGKQKAIVTDIEGTTRDWVSARCRIGPLSVELFDTAGLDEKSSAAPRKSLEKISQQKTAEVLENADLVLLVLDAGQPAEQLNSRLLEKIAGRKILTVLNKSDLPAGLDTAELPEFSADKVQISAKFGTGIENLLRKIPQICGAANFDLKSPVCFTSRQENLLKELHKAKSKHQAASIITELLNGQL